MAGRAFKRRTDLKRAPEAKLLDLALKKVEQAEAALRELKAADPNGAVPMVEFGRMLAVFGVLIREAWNKLDKADHDRFRTWWTETRPQSQLVVLTDEDRRKVELVIDSCNDEHHASGPALDTARGRNARHRFEFITESGNVPVIQASERAFGLMHRLHLCRAGGDNGIQTIPMSAPLGATADPTRRCPEGLRDALQGAAQVAGEGLPAPLHVEEEAPARSLGEPVFMGSHAARMTKKSPAGRASRG